MVSFFLNFNIYLEKNKDMKLCSAEFYEIELHDTYAILTTREDQQFTLEKANQIRKELIAFYGKNKFVLINYRKYNHKISKDIYKQGQLQNMKGLAIVSQLKTERDKALIEQKLYDKSFAFFDNLDEAISWAQNYFF